MIPLPPREHRLLIAIHGWSGVALGLLLYVVLATGTVAVLAHEIGLWSSGALQTRAALTRPLDAIAAQVIGAAPPALRETVDFSASAAGRLHAALRDLPGPDQRGVDLEIAPDGRTLRRREGSATEIEGGDPEGALSAFILGLHVRLYVPAPWGYAITGAAGLALLVAALSGLVVHRHLLREAFTLRRTARPALVARDRHNLAGTWALPFALLLAVTGCFFSFAVSVGFPALAWVSYGGDQQALFTAISGTPPPAAPEPAASADLDAVVADAVARSGTAPEYLRLAHPGRADARVTVYAEARDGDVSSATLVYDGVSGAFLEQRPAIGRVPSAGGTLYGLMAPLHFGDFAGLASKVAWAALGFCCCYATAGGLRLWLVRRGVARPGWAALDRANSVATFGLPFAMATAAVGFFAGLPGGTSVPSTTAGFVGGAAAAALAGAALPRRSLDGALRAATGLTLALLPPIRLAAGGPGWETSLSAGQVVVPAGDLTMLALGLVFLAEPVRVGLRRRRDRAVAATAS